TRITSDGSVYRYGPVWSPDNKKLLYWDKVHRLWYVAIGEKKPVLVDENGYGDIADGSWAPDSNWLAYSKTDRRGAGQLFLYSLEQKKATKVSDGFYNDSNPVFDPDGKYLFFFSQRYFFPSTGQLDQRFSYYTTDGVFALTLKADEESPVKPQSDEEKGADKGKEKDKEKKDEGKSSGKGAKKEETKKDDKKDEKKKEKNKEPKPVHIDFDGIKTRVAPLPIAGGIYGNLAARKGTVFFLAQPQEARTQGTEHDQDPRNVLHAFDLEKREDKELLSGIDAYDLSFDG